MNDLATTQLDYGTVFRELYRSLLNAGTPQTVQSKLEEALTDFRARETRTFSDNEYFEQIVAVTFYSGFRADTVTKRMPTIRKHLGDYRRTAGYGDDDIQQILNDPGMLRNRSKIKASVENAKTFARLIESAGSFQSYMDNFGAKNKVSQDLGPLKKLRDCLRSKFRYLGGITAFHFMMEFGMPVLKPDRVIARIFDRLRLIRSRPLADPPTEAQMWEAIASGREFARQTGHPIRYVDLVFVLYGQVKSDALGIDKGICLKDPLCAKCGIRDYCQYEQKSVGESQ